MHYPQLDSRHNTTLFATNTHPASFSKYDGAPISNDLNLPRDPIETQGTLSSHVDPLPYGLALHSTFDLKSHRQPLAGMQPVLVALMIGLTCRRHSKA